MQSGGARHSYYPGEWQDTTSQCNTTERLKRSEVITGCGMFSQQQHQHLNEVLLPTEVKKSFDSVESKQKQSGTSPRKGSDLKD